MPDTIRNTAALIALTPDNTTGAISAQDLRDIVVSAYNRLDDAIPAGPTGPTGADGKTVRSGTTAPSGGLGVDGDFYIRTTTSELYGPKASGSWGSPVSLIGPAGSNGTNGTDGDTGDTGPTGEAGPAGQTGDAGAAGRHAGFRYLTSESNPNAGDIACITGSFYIHRYDSDGNDNGDFLNECVNTGASGAMVLIFPDATSEILTYSSITAIGGDVYAIQLISYSDTWPSTITPVMITVMQTGHKGDTGDTGPIGSTGSAGETGPTGEQGPTGPSEITDGTTTALGGVTGGIAYRGTSNVLRFGPAITDSSGNLEGHTGDFDNIVVGSGNEAYIDSTGNVSAASFTTLSGLITGGSFANNGSSFTVDNVGNSTAKSLSLNDGSLAIASAGIPTMTVDSSGNIVTTGNVEGHTGDFLWLNVGAGDEAYIDASGNVSAASFANNGSSFTVDNAGNVLVESLDVNGNATIDSTGNIGGASLTSETSLAVGSGAVFQVDTTGTITNPGCTIDNAGNLTLASNATFNGSFFYAPALPTSDPANAGQIWNDGGTLKVSAG